MFSGFMINAWAVATIVAVVAGVVGFFVVLRGSAFAAHAIPNGAFAGAAGATLLGVNPLVGLAVFSVLGAAGHRLLGRRGRHDVATALALVMMLALGGAVPEPEHRVRAGDLLPALRRGPGRQHAPSSCPSALIGLPASIAVSRALPAAHAVLRRARGRRGPAGARAPHGVGFLLVIALATAMTVPVVGALLIFSLMIGPPAAARSLTARPLGAMALSVALALVTVWAAIASSYLSNWPVGFFVGMLSAACYGLGRGVAAGRRSRRSRHPVGPGRSRASASSGSPPPGPAPALAG